MAIDSAATVRNFRRKGPKGLKRPVFGRILGQVRAPIQDIPHLNVVLPYLHSRQRLRYLIEKATELGASKFIAVGFQRSQHQSKYDEPKSSTDSSKSVESLLREWAVEAAEQSERMTIPAVVNALDLNFVNNSSEIFALAQSSCVFVYKERSPQDSHLLDAALSRWQSKTINNDHGIAVVVGPEGGLSPEELDALAAVGSGTGSVRFVSLGDGVLRSETAVVTAMSILSAVFRRCGSSVTT